MTMFKQRGNLTECVQWNGFNIEEVKAFLAPRLNKSLKDLAEEGLLEFIRTEFLHLIIIANHDTRNPLIVGRQAISHGTWLVDQGPLPENPLGVVFCEPKRFKHLYEVHEAEGDEQE